MERAKSKMRRYYNLHKEFPEYATSFRFDSKSSEEILDRFEFSMIKEWSKCRCIRRAVNLSTLM